MNKAYQYQAINPPADVPSPGFRSPLRLILLLCCIAFTGLLLWGLFAWALGSYRVLSNNPGVWQSSIDRLNREDLIPAQQAALAQQPVIFVGSSSIRLFHDLDTIFYKNPVIKKGFGGAKIQDVIHYRQDLILQYQPKLVVFYLGVNDVLYRDYENISELTTPLFTLLNELQRKQPHTYFVLLAQRPIDTPRFSNEIHAYNIALADYALQQHQVFFVDINDALMRPDRTLNPELLHWDGLHLNENGYRVWGNAIYKQLSALHLVE